MPRRMLAAVVLAVTLLLIPASGEVASAVDCLVAAQTDERFYAQTINEFASLATYLIVDPERAYASVSVTKYNQSWNESGELLKVSWADEGSQGDETLIDLVNDRSISGKLKGSLSIDLDSGQATMAGALTDKTSKAKVSAVAQGDDVLIAEGLNCFDVFFESTTAPRARSSWAPFLSDMRPLTDVLKAARPLRLRP